MNSSVRKLVGPIVCYVLCLLVCQILIGLTGRYANIISP